MKICYKCGCGNSDNAVVCKECSASLTDAAVRSSEKIIEEKERTREKNEKVMTVLKLSLIPLYYAILIPIFIVCVKREAALLILMIILSIIPIFYYLNVFKADLMFDLNMIFNPNIKNAEPTDHYYFTSTLSGYILLIFGIAFAIYLYFSVN